MTFRLVLAFLLGIAGIVLVLVKNRSVPTDYGKNEVKVPFRTIGFGVLGAAVFFALLATVRVVSPGQVGIPVVFGDAKTPIGNGVHFVNPFSSVKRLSVRTEEYTMSAKSSEGAKSGNDAVDVLGADGATGQVDATLLYRLDEKAASRVYRQLGTNFTQKVVRPTARTCVRDAFTRREMVDAATKGRTEVSKNIESCIEANLSPRGIILENFQLRDVSLGTKVQAAIDSKVEAQQGAEQQAFELSKTKQQAEIRREEARGLADAQRIIQATLTPEYLQYQYINTLKETVNSPNNTTVILPFDQKLTPLLNLPNPKG